MNSSKLTLDAYYDLLAGVISVEVFKRIPEDAPKNYVWLRVESGFDVSNKRSLSDEVVIITESVTEFENVGDDSVVEGIDNEVVSLIIPSAGTMGLVNPSGIQILNIKREQFYPPEEKDGLKVFLRKISRYSQRVTQL